MPKGFAPLCTSLWTAMICCSLSQCFFTMACIKRAPLFRICSLFHIGKGKWWEHRGSKFGRWKGKHNKDSCLWAYKPLTCHNCKHWIISLVYLVNHFHFKNKNKAPGFFMVLTKSAVPGIEQCHIISLAGDLGGVFRKLISVYFHMFLYNG